MKIVVWKSPKVLSSLLRRVFGVKMCIRDSISLVPQTYVKLESDEDIKNMEKLLDMLDDNEDVQNTYHNCCLLYTSTGALWPLPLLL